MTKEQINEIKKYLGVDLTYESTSKIIYYFESTEFDKTKYYKIKTTKYYVITPNQIGLKIESHNMTTGMKQYGHGLITFKQIEDIKKILRGFINE